MNQYNNERERIMNEWFAKGNDALTDANYFEAFIYIWISWVVACKIDQGYNRNTDDLKNRLEDGKLVEKWSERNGLLIGRIVQKNLLDLRMLGYRKGGKFKNPIVDFSQNSPTKFENLSAYFRDEFQYASSRDLARDMAQLLNKIRNNLFHGGKLYSSEDDRGLLIAVLPTLRDLAEAAIERNSF